MTTAVINDLLAELSGRGIRLVVQQGELVARGPAGAMTADLAGRLKQHKAALVAALSGGDVAPVIPSAESAATAELPPGWPEDVPQPPWWPEFLAIKGDIQILAARKQQCGDPDCRFPVMIRWTLPGDALRLWSCPKCGRTADPPEQDLYEWRFPATPRPGFRVKPKVCGWCGPNTTWWQDDNGRWRCMQCNPPVRQVSAERIS